MKEKENSFPIPKAKLKNGNLKKLKKYFIIVTERKKKVNFKSHFKKEVNAL